MKLSDQELIAIGLQVQEARRKGGEKIRDTHDKNYFKDLNKLSQASRKAKKLKRRTII